MKNLYEILGIEENASQREIKKAYRNLAKEWHPDANLDNVEEATKKFQEIENAYSILKDAKKRKLYDETGQTRNQEDDTEVRIKTAAIAAFFEVVQHPQFDIESTDIFKKIKDSYDIGIAQASQGIIKATKTIDKLGKIKKRLFRKGKKKKESMNIFIGAADNMIESGHTEIKRLQSEIEFKKTVIKYIEDYGYNFDEFDMSNSSPRGLTGLASLLR